MNHTIPASCWWRHSPRVAFDGLPSRLAAVSDASAASSAAGADVASADPSASMSEVESPLRYAPFARLPSPPLHQQLIAASLPYALLSYAGLQPPGSVGSAALDVDGARQMLRSACVAFAGAGVIRFAATPLTAAQWDITFNRGNGSMLWTALAALASDAAASGCRLLPVLFWSPWTVPDAYSEPLGLVMDMTKPSQARAAQLSFAEELVRRLAGDPVVAGWDIGNAHNLLLDTALAAAVPRVWPLPASGAAGAPPRSAADDISTAAFLDWQRAVVDVIRGADPLRRPISSGHAWPRANAASARRAVPANADLPDAIPFCFVLRLSSISSG